MRKIFLPFSITAFHSAHDFSWESGFAYSGESHDFWEAVYVVSGEAQVTEGVDVYRLGVGEIIFHAPMEFHSIKSEKETPTRVRIFTFTAEGELPGRLTDGPFLLAEEEREDFRRVFSRVYAFYHAEEEGEYDGLLCACALAEFLTAVGKEVSAPAGVFTPSARMYNEAVVAMTAYLYENRTLEEIAATCHISVSYMKLLFARFAGVPPKRYYEMLRMREAISLLRDGLPACEVAARLSFSSPGYFSVWLRRVSGSLPTDIGRGRDDRRKSKK